MNKAELSQSVMTACGLDTKRQADEVVEAVFDTITKTLARGEDVSIVGFGAFKVAHRAARTGVNPKTGEKIQIAAKKAPKFKAGKQLKEAVA